MRNMTIYTECNIWHDDGDDGITGWQPIGEPLIKRQKENQQPRPGGQTGQEN